MNYQMISFDGSLPMILHRTLERIMPAYRDLFAYYDLTEQQWRILRVLWEAKKVTSAELATRTLIPSPSLVGIIDRLIRKGLVVRTRSTEDRRVVHILPTPKGIALEVEVAPKVAQIDATLRSHVSPAQWAAMEEALASIATRQDRLFSNDAQPTSSSGE